MLRAASLALATLLSLACAVPGARPTPAPAAPRAFPGPIALEGGSPLFTRFDAESGRPRLLVLASPT